MPIYVVYSLASPRGRRRLIVNILLLALLFWFADYLHNHPLAGNQQQEPPPAGAQNLADAGSANTPVFAAEPPTWLTAAVILAGSVLVVAVIFGAVWLYQRSRPQPDSALDQLAEAAQSTVTAIQAGGDFKQTVIRCYHDMMQVVKAEKGIARDAAMTPHEFEDRLVEKGLPQEAIRTLTRLFEQVRYGSLPTSPGDEALAVSSLTDIVVACGGRREAQ